MQIISAANQLQERPDSTAPRDTRQCTVAVLILWHMHQPYYVLPGQRKALLPWTRLHALKDYADMPALLGEFPTVHVTFNLVPSLLWQLRDYAQGRLTDIDLEVSDKPAVDLTKEERIYLLRNFFSLDWAKMLPRFPRLAELLKKRGRALYQENLPVLAEKFSVQDFLDLQVLFNLAWSGKTLLDLKPVHALVHKQRGFTEEDKKSLLSVQTEFLGAVLPAYQRAAASGRIEISTSPFYHPILPLLVSTELGRESDARTPLPGLRFQYPCDAEDQILAAGYVMENEFGFRCTGMWPSEGSVAEDLIPFWERAGIRWVASDEEVLWNSLRRSGIRTPQRHELYTPYRIKKEEAEVAIFFRDHELSDLLGFSYSRWKPDKAAQDFIGRILRIRDNWKGSAPAAISIILDGENAWEHYDENGRPFLREFYGRLAATPGVKTSTFSEWLESFPEMPTLPKLHPGSWIFGNFNTWMGHPEKNRGWEELARARQALADSQELVIATGVDLTAASEAMYRAEGSDWFWWYGDDHASEHKEEFDRLFRANLQEVYRSLARPIPPSLERSLRLPAPVRPHSLPTVLIHPQIDGRVSHFFEWRGAGAFQVRGGGAMQQVDSLLDTIYFGYDHERLYFRLDFRETSPLKGSGRRLAIWMQHTGVYCLQLAYDTAARQFQVVPPPLPRKEGQPLDGSSVELAYGQVLEIAFPVSAISIREAGRLEIAVELLQNERVLERWPHLGSWEFNFAPIELDQNSWYI